MVTFCCFVWCARLVALLRLPLLSVIVNHTTLLRLLCCYFYTPQTLVNFDAMVGGGPGEPARRVSNFFCLRKGTTIFVSYCNRIFFCRQCEKHDVLQKYTTCILMYMQESEGVCLLGRSGFAG